VDEDAVSRYTFLVKLHARQKEILLIAPYEQMYVSALRIARDKKYRNIGIAWGNLEEGLGQALNAVETQARVLISRGGTYRMIKQAEIGVPVVEIRFSPFDLIESLSAAIEKDRPLAIVGYSNIISSRDEALLKRLIKTRLTIVNINDGDDVPEVVRSCADKGFSMFIGDTIVKETCDAAGFECYLHQSNDSSIQAAMDEALRIYAALKQELELTRRLRTVINFVHDGIIAVDADGKVILFNAIAQDLLEVKQEKILGEPAASLSGLPFASPAAAAQMTDGTFKVGNRLLSFSMIPVSLESDSFGSVIIIRDVKKIQDWEQKLRLALAEKGFVAKHSFTSIVHKSAGMSHCISIAKKFSPYNASVLIEGESGVGKELFAQSIHNDSPRRGGPFVAVNCAVLPKSLIESELFGYVEGAFTGSKKGGKAGYFELAHRGTLFLDEISELPLDMQAQLLRVIQEKEVMRLGDTKILPVDVRLICAANKNLVAMVRQSLFRKDLLFRINTLSLYIPPLAERREDIELLADHFLKVLCKTYGKTAAGFSPRAALWLRNYPYEGNVRELRNMIERAVVVSEGKMIRLSDLQGGLRGDTPVSDPEREEPAAGISLDDAEKNHIIRVWADNGRSVSKTAAALGISRTTLWRKMRNLGV
jgi:transcriptional regulator with PAS, ATPase and Fis domain